MKFPNAHSGVKKLFICEIISIVAAALTIIGATIAAIGLKKEGLLLTGGTIILISGIALVVVFILQLVGLHQAGKDEIQIKYAFCATILGIILGVVASILESVSNAKGTQIAVAVINAIQTVAELLAAFYVLSGISALAGKLNDQAMEKQGRKLANWVIIFFIASIVFEFLGVILKENPTEWLAVLAGILVIVAGFVQLVVYIITFIYYCKAVKMLEK